MKVCPKCEAPHSKNGMYCSRSCANSRTWTYDPDLHVEKFAELIVRECIGCCDEVDRINKAYIEKLQFDPENGPKECIQVIKEHFGVEE